METRRRADTRGRRRPAPGPRSLPRSPAGCRGPARLAARPAAPPHMGPRRHIGGRAAHVRAGLGAAAGAGRWPARRRRGAGRRGGSLPRARRGPPATRKCLLAAASSLHPGPRLPPPAPGGAARGCGRRARAAGPPPLPSPAPRSGGGVRPCRAASGRGVPGGARPCAGPEPAYPARRLPGARSRVDGGREPSRGLRAARG